ncbi:MAG TPA: HEAT repeat domain-containing protein [Actinomycetes bacterium]|jgi:HEAT repeat protein|nr:HEAT repeat domain-containing protein [Actinomycetes bacterium]
MTSWELSPEAQAAVDELHRVGTRPGAVRLAAELGGPAAIPSLLELAAGPDPAIRAAALDAAGQLLAAVPPARLRRLDTEVRRRWPRTGRAGPGAVGGWVRIGPPAGTGPLSAERAGTAPGAAAPPMLLAAALAAMHPDGRVREEAVRQLDAVGGGEALSYLLVRTGDRVPQVRRAARAAVTRRLEPRYIPALALNLALVERLAAGQRAGTVLAWTARLLEHPEHRHHVVRVLAAGDLATRRAAARMLAAMPWDDPAGVLEAALGQDDAVAAATVVDTALDQLEGDELRRLLQRLLGQPVAGLRQRALRTLVARFPDEAPETLRQALLDHQAAVRTVAQRLLRARGEDVAGRYRAALGGRPDPAVALLGLGETGTAGDAELARRWLADPDPAVRRAAVRAVARLDPGARVGELRAALADPDPDVSRAARSGLRRRVAQAGPDRLWALCTSTRHGHVRRHCLALLARLGRWQRLRFALLAAMEPQPDLAEAGRQLLRCWLASWDPAAPGPTPAEVAELRRLLPLARASLGAGLTGVLVAALRPFTSEPEAPVEQVPPTSRS